MLFDMVFNLVIQLKESSVKWVGLILLFYVFSGSSIDTSTIDHSNLSSKNQE